jgi:hypothetical protein
LELSERDFLVVALFNFPATSNLLFDLFFVYGSIIPEESSRIVSKVSLEVNKDVSREKLGRGGGFVVDG